VDVALVSLAVSAVRLLPELMWEEVLGRAAPGWLATVAAAAALVLPWVYFTVSWWLNGQTVGALVLGLVALRRDGREMSLPHAALRAAVGLTLAPLWIIGLLTVLWDDRRRSLLDRLFRTVVCYAGRVARPTNHRPERA
jgi:uncharacterized RDD family membrane protein YckC